MSDYFTDTQLLRMAEAEKAALRQQLTATEGKLAALELEVDRRNRELLMVSVARDNWMAEASRRGSDLATAVKALKKIEGHGFRLGIDVSEKGYDMWFTAREALASINSKEAGEQ